MKKFVLENISIHDIADKGQAVGKSGEKVVFVTGAVLGDVVDVEIFKKHKSYDEGKVIRIVEPSPLRQQPRCPHFGLCGGCKWQHFSYSGQLHHKQKQVHDALTRIGRISPDVISPIKGSALEYYYRNKLEFTFTRKRYLEKHEMGSDEPKD